MLRKCKVAVDPTEYFALLIGQRPCLSLAADGASAVQGADADACAEAQVGLRRAKNKRLFPIALVSVFAFHFRARLEFLIGTVHRD